MRDAGGGYGVGRATGATLASRRSRGTLFTPHFAITMLQLALDAAAQIVQPKTKIFHSVISKCGNLN